jgi:nucleotide-binding universal stress UspA family protein
MFDKVLVPVDLSTGSRAAASAVKEIPGVRQIVLLHVVYTRYPPKDPAIVPPQVSEALSALEEMKKELSMPGVAITTLCEMVTGGEIADIINQAAQKLGISLIVMGRRGTGIIETLVLGSVASDILRYGNTDLLLIPSPPKGSPYPDTPPPALFSHVMACTDFSEPEIGFICLEELPGIQRVSIFHAVTTGASDNEVQSATDEAELRLTAIRDAFSRSGIPACSEVAIGSAVEEILVFSEREDVSLILMKSSGKKSYLNVIIGSTSAPFARSAKKPVLILKRSLAVRKDKIR